MAARAIFMHVYEQYKEQLPHGNVTVLKPQPQSARPCGLMDMVGNVIRNNSGMPATQNVAPQTELERYFDDQYPAGFTEH